MERLILLAIAAIIISILLGQVIRGGLGLLRLLTIGAVAFLFVLLSARTVNSPGLLTSLTQRIWSENAVPEAVGPNTETGAINNSGDVNSTVSPSSADSSRGVVPSETNSSAANSDVSRPFGSDASLSSGVPPASAEAAFSGASSTVGSTQLPDDTPVQASDAPVTTEFSTQATQPPATTSVESVPSSVGVAPTPNQSRISPPPSQSRPITALW